MVQSDKNNAVANKQACRWLKVYEQTLMAKGVYGAQTHLQKKHSIIAILHTQSKVLLVVGEQSSNH